ncbi:Vascular endothelial growth factor receptor 1 [Channa argus]|uniref:Platelet-derived growth factor receptor-like protein n=1 Tax=Channa argus TaxID=215402 RepID=A0A6G1QMQ3_CHAAH|nr:Vascular endothelial growth factor receptor 1 [Channa argus]
MMNYILICMLCGLYGVHAKDKEPKGKYSVPLLDVKTQQLVLHTNQPLLLSCRGRKELKWVLPSGLATDQVQVEESRCGKKNQQYCSHITVNNSQAEHTGSFRCRYRHRPQNQTSVYVYVTDSQRPFVEDPGKSPDVLYLKKNQPLVIPCRVTHPNVTTTLEKQFPNQSLKPDQRNIIWNSKRGFIIRAPTLFDTGLFCCQTIRHGVTYMSPKYFVYRPVNNIMEVRLNVSGPVQALKGQRLVLNCTASAELNTRVNFTWDYPGKIVNTGSFTNRLLKHQTHMFFYSILTLPKLQRSDRGIYTCRVASGEQTKQQRVTVTVYDRPFIRLKPRHGSVMEVQAGQKSYRISPKLKAFPVPEVLWLKDGMKAADQCSRYVMDGNSLVIRDVAEEDAGQYTVLVRIQEHRLYQNLTLTLTVNVSPQIGEKEVSLQDPGTVPQGSRKTIHCTSHGVPPPHIQWLWHACPPKGPPLFFAARLHHRPDAMLEGAQGQWTRLGQGDGGPHAWVLGPLLGLALGTTALLSGPGRRRTGLPVRKSERFSSRCLASSPMRDASQQRDCPFGFKRGTVHFLKSLIYSGEPPPYPSTPHTSLPTHKSLQPLPSSALPSTQTQYPPPLQKHNSSSPPTLESRPSTITSTHSSVLLHSSQTPQWHFQ